MDKEYYIKLQAKLEDNEKTVAELNNQIKSLQGKVSKLQLKVDSQKVSKADKQLKSLNNTAKEGKKQADKWNYSWSKAFQSFTTYMSVTTVFYQVIHTIKDMISEVTDLDGALVELKKVTDLEGESLQKFTKEAYAAGTNVAKTGTEMVEAATSFAKAGYSEDQILQLGEVAAMYTNIADEAISSADAADFIIAQLKAFNLESDDLNKTLENSYHIIDAVNEVSNNFAVSSSDIATNLGKASSVMANAGNSMEQMIGLMTAGTEVTRNASKVANGLKTITLRLQGMDDEGEESLELMAQMEGLFNKLGKTVYNTDGTLKNTYDLLGELADVYPTLTAAEKAYVTETIAGKYQAQNAAAILSNWKTAVDATATALDSQGSAMKENSKYLDSIQGKMANFNSAFEQLSQNIISSDLIKWFIDLGTTILNIANSDFGKFTTKLSAIFLLSKSGITLIGKFGKSIKNTHTLLQKYKEISAVAKASTNSMVTAEEAKILVDGKAAMSQLALNAALGGIALALTAGITLWQKYQQAEQEAMQKAVDDSNTLTGKNSDIDNMSSKLQQLRDITDSSSSSYKESADARKELIDIQNDLINNYGAEADKIDLVSGSIEKQIEYLKQLKQENAQDYLTKHKSDYDTAYDKIYDTKRARQTYGSDVSRALGKENKWDNDVKNITFLGKDADKQKKEYIEQQKFYQQYVDDYEKIMNRYGKITEQRDGKKSFISKNVDSEKKALEEWQKYLDQNEDKIISSGIMSKDEYKDTYKYISDALNSITKKYESFYNTLSEYQKQQLTAAGYDDFKEKLLELSKTNVLTEDSIQKLIDKYPELGDALSKNGISISDIMKEYQNLDTVYDKLLSDNDDLAKALGDISLDGVVTEEEIEGLKNKFPELEEEIKNTGFSLDDIIEKFPDFIYNSVDSIDKLIEQMDALQDAYDITTSAMEEYNDVGYFSIDTLEQLLQLEPQYLSAIVDENGVIRDNTSMFRALAEAKLDDMQASEDDRYMKELNRLATMSEAQAAQLAAASINAHDQAMAGQEVNAAALRAQIQQNIEAFDEEAAAALRAAAAKNEEEHAQKNALIANTRAGLKKNYKTSIGGYSPSKSSSSSKKSEKEWWETELENLQNQFKYNEITIEEYIRGLDNLLGKVEKGTDAWRKINEELQKQRLTKVEDDYKRGTISLDEYIKKLKELIKAYKQGSDAWNDLADKIKKALQDKADKQKDALDTAEDAAVGIIDDEIDKLKKLKEEQEDYYDKLIDDKKAANDETEKELELARLQEALANAQKEKTKRVWREGIGWVWEADQEAIREAQEALDEFNREQELDALEKQKEEAIKNIEDQIDAWEKYKESWENVADDYETQQARMTLAQQLGADAEAKILQKRLDVLEDYKSKYLATMKEITDLENTPSDKLNGYDTPKDTNTTNGNSSSGGSSSSAPSLNKGSYVSVKPGTKWYANSYGGGNSGTARSGTIKYINNGGSHPYNIDGLGWVKKSDIVGYKNGGMVDYTGLAMLHGTKSKPEFVLNNDQMKSMLSNFIRPQTSSNLPSKNASVTNYNFGNIELPNVSNAKQFVTELKSLVNITKHQ